MAGGNQSTSTPRINAKSAEFLEQADSPVAQGESPNAADPPPHEPVHPAAQTRAGPDTGTTTGRARRDAIAKTLADEAVLEPSPSPAAIIQHVALALYMHAGYDNIVSGLTVTDLAAETRLTTNEVDCALSVLERTEMVWSQPDPDGGTMYILRLPPRLWPAQRLWPEIT